MSTILCNLLMWLMQIYISLGLNFDIFFICLYNSNSFSEMFLGIIIFIFIINSPLPPLPSLYPLLGICIVVMIIVYLYRNVKAIKHALQKFAMKLPLFGNIIIYNEMTIFTKTFSSLLKNNVFITESIEILSKITRNEIYKEIMFDTINNIAKGEKISTSFKDNWAIPEVAYYMIVTGESTGELASMMSKVSQYYQEEHRNIINSLKSLIEPIMIIFLAVVVGGVVLSVIIPMFSLYGQIS